MTKNFILKLAKLHSVWIICISLICMMIVFFLAQLILPWYIAHFGDFEGVDKIDSLALTIIVSVFIG
jgi:hypothetical protein